MEGGFAVGGRLRGIDVGDCDFFAGEDGAQGVHGLEERVRVEVVVCVWAAVVVHSLHGLVLASTQ